MYVYLYVLVTDYDAEDYWFMAGKYKYSRFSAVILSMMNEKLAPEYKYH